MSFLIQEREMSRWIQRYSARTEPPYPKLWKSSVHYEENLNVYRHVESQGYRTPHALFHAIFIITKRHGYVQR